MKRTQKILGIISLAMLMIGTLVTTASAATVGDPYTWGGFHIGYGLIILGIIVVGGGWYLLKGGKGFGTTAIIAAVLILAGAFSFTGVAPEPAEITPSITWSVSATVDAGNMTIDDDARTITILYYENVSDEIINQTDSTAWVSPIINFTISPTQTTGLVDTSLGATTLASVNNPDKEFTEDSTTYDLFQDASGENKKDLEWDADDTTEYETHYCTVSFGSSETVLLTIELLDDGLCQCEAGDSESFTISIGGITYTASVICTGSAT